jgi:tRNA(fMet)-specific endonuclease VapC
MTGLDRALLDTNIVSYLLKGRPQAKGYEDYLAGRLLCISFITVGELYFWAEDSQWGEQRRAKLERELHSFVVSPYDHRIARSYGLLCSLRKRAGRPISCADAWVAACALTHSIDLVTHNRKDFAGIPGLTVISGVAP